MSTIENDLRLASSEEEREAIKKTVLEKYRSEFLDFIEILKKSEIAHNLYNAHMAEETLKIWENFSAKNNELSVQMRQWAENRISYLNTYELLYMFEEAEIEPILLESGLMLIIIGDETLFSEEDLCTNFTEKLVALLTQKRNNILINAAGYYFSHEGYDTITKENIFDFV